jgi:hypothetical protein
MRARSADSKEQAMPLGDGVRRNVRTISAAERERFKNALLVVQGTHPYASLEEIAAGAGWTGEYDLRQAVRLHRGPAFLPWHRELCNRFEQMLRDVDPDLSLHYWDWNEGPGELFTPPGLTSHLPDRTFEGVGDGVSWTPEDAEIIDADSYPAMRTLLERKHDAAHFVYFGGTFVNAHNSFHDPGAFLLHSNVDRLFAMWQAQDAHAWRLDPAQVYGREGALLGSALVDPPAGFLRAPSPWLPQDTHAPRTYAHPSIVAPPCYDTLPTRVMVDPVTNPGQIVNFNDVYSGKTFARAASFLVYGGGNVTFAVTAGPTGPYAVITPGGAITAAHSRTLYQEARIWFAYTGAAPDTSAPAGTVTIRCRETSQDFTFTLLANTVPLPAGGVQLSLDGTGAPAGPGTRAESANVTWTWTWKAV